MILEDDRIEIMLARVADISQDTRGMGGTLDARERMRAAGFQFASDRNRYVMRRWLLRRLLQHCLHSPSSFALDIREDTRGKPYLAESAGTSALRFNYSYSEEFIAFAFCLNRDVGIDIEKIRPLPEMLAIARNYFTGSEFSRLRQQPEELRPSLFFRIWTRKEAVLKALGEGLSRPLDSFPVLADGDPTQPLGLAPSPGSGAASLFVRDLEAPAGFACAVAVQGARCPARIHRLSTSAGPGDWRQLNRPWH